MTSDRRKQGVLFVCTHNSARSQMAEGLLRHLYGDRYEARSAGTEPGSVHPLAIKAMAEIGIDISMHRSKGVDEFADHQLDYVITVCDHARETCPFFPGGARRLHKSFQDPSAFRGSTEEHLGLFRGVRDRIGDWIEETFGPRQDRPDPHMTKQEGEEHP